MKVLDAASFEDRWQIPDDTVRPVLLLMSLFCFCGLSCCNVILCTLVLTLGFLYFRLKPALHFVSWNQEGWKTSLCSVPPVGHSHSLLALANNTCVKPTFMELRERFMRLYRKKVITHLVTELTLAEMIEVRANAVQRICYIRYKQREVRISTLNEKFREFLGFRQYTIFVLKKNHLFNNFTNVYNVF